jgi:hypothetical protein
MQAIVYHWWSNTAIEKTFRCPILCSIATLRHHDEKIPVYVLDVTENSKHDWSQWEKKLNFKAVKWTPYFRGLGFKNIDFFSLTEPSRHLDVYNFGKTIDADVLFYSDSDVFYLSPIGLLDPGDRITSPVYTAYFYFDKYGQKAIKFLDAYRDLCLKCLIDDNFVKNLYQYCPYNIKGRRLWSEVITYYADRCLNAAHLKALIRSINHAQFANLDKAYQFKRIDQARTVHLFFNGVSKYDEMDGVALFKELRKPAEKFLGHDFVEKLKPGVKKQISLYDQGFANHIYKLTKDTGYKPMDKFIDESYAYANQK